MESLIKDLQDIGLSEKEAKVYLAVLELGQETVQKISDKSGVNRATTYVILESLIKKGLVATYEQKKKTVFIAEGPHSLNNIIREQEEDLEQKVLHLEEMMPQLHTLYNLHPNKPKVTFYTGKEGLKEMLKEHFLKMESDSVDIVFSPEAVSKLFTRDEMIEQKDRRVEKKIHVDAVYSSDKDEKIALPLADMRKVSSKEYPFDCDIEVYDDKVMISFLAGDVSGLIIENPDIAYTFRSIFKLAFEASQEV